VRTGWLHAAALCAAFWTAALLYRGDRPARFVTALALGAALAHGGWALLHLPAVLDRPQALLDVSRGFSVLFAPLGLLLLTPTPAALATLPLALAVARTGCLAAGSCHGPAGQPTPLVEIAGLLVLHAGLRRVPERWVVPAVLAGFGGLRLATEPWRAEPPLGEPLIAPGALAALWVGAAALWAVQGSQGARRQPRASTMAW
jgi:hypothetical protein